MMQEKERDTVLASEGARQMLNRYVGLKEILVKKNLEIKALNLSS